MAVAVAVTVSLSFSVTVTSLVCVTVTEPTPLPPSTTAPFAALGDGPAPDPVVLLLVSGSSVMGMMTILVADDVDVSVAVDVVESTVGAAWVLVVVGIGGEENGCRDKKLKGSGTGTLLDADAVSVAAGGPVGWKVSVTVTTPLVREMVAVRVTGSMSEDVRDEMDCAEEAVVDGDAVPGPSVLTVTVEVPVPAVTVTVEVLVMRLRAVESVAEDAVLVSEADDAVDDAVAGGPVEEAPSDVLGTIASGTVPKIRLASATSAQPTITPSVVFMGSAKQAELGSGHGMISNAPPLGHLPRPPATHAA